MTMKGYLAFGLILLTNASLLGQDLEDNHFSVIFALKPESAENVVFSYAANDDGQLFIKNAQLPFRLQAQTKNYQIERIYPLDPFKNPLLRKKFETRLGGRLFVAKVKVKPPFDFPFVLIKLLGEFNQKQEVIFASLSPRLYIPEQEKILEELVPTETIIGYNIKITQTDLAWTLTEGNKDIIVAVIDTGSNLDHVDLKGNGFVNYDEIPNNKIDDDGNGVVDDYDKGVSVNEGVFNNDGSDVSALGHGTAVASVVGARGIGLKGIAPTCRILPIRFLGPSGAGTFEDSFLAEAFAIETIATKGPERPFKGWINNSFGGGFFEKPAMVYKILFDIAYKEGIGISSASGNSKLDNDLARTLPASIESPSHIAVAATNEKDELAGFSNFGKNTVKHAAPGNFIPVATGKNSYNAMSGTSFSSPHDAGAAVLISSLFPNASVDEIIARILFGSDLKESFKDLMLVEGRLNTFRMLEKDPIPPSIIEWASPLTLNHNQASIGWYNPLDDSNNYLSPPASAVRITVFSENGEEFSFLRFLKEKGFQKTELTGLKENTRYFIRMSVLDNVGNESRPIFLPSFITPSSVIIFEDDFETIQGFENIKKNEWTLVPQTESNLWHLTRDRFSPESQKNPTVAYRFGRKGLPDYNPKKPPEGHIVSPSINLKEWSGLELEMDLFMSGDFIFDTMLVILRTEFGTKVPLISTATVDEKGNPGWQKLITPIDGLTGSSMRIDVFFTTNGSGLFNSREGAYVDNIKIKASKPVIFFPDPTTN